MHLRAEGGVAGSSSTSYCSTAVATCLCCYCVPKQDKQSSAQLQPPLLLLRLLLLPLVSRPCCCCCCWQVAAGHLPVLSMFCLLKHRHILDSGCDCPPLHCCMLLLPCAQTPRILPTMCSTVTKKMKPKLMTMTTTGEIFRPGESSV